MLEFFNICYKPFKMPTAYSDYSIKIRIRNNTINVTNKIAKN